MRYPILMLASLLLATAVQAQTAPAVSRASDSWNAPARAATVGYRDAGLPLATDGASSHFKFKERSNRGGLPDNAAQQESGKARVGGMGEMDRSGRPAVSCPQTPMDPACH